MTTMPVKREMKIPRRRVRAKPRTAPEAFKKDQSSGLKRIRPVIMVARLASLIEFQARPKPNSRLTGQERPALISSR